MIMEIIDLTHFITPDMPVYPGTEPPVLISEFSVDEAGFMEKKIIFYSHTGTHIDAPAHLIKDAKTLDRLPIEQFYGSAFLLNLADVYRKTIDIKELEANVGIIKKTDFLLIHTGWSLHWGTARYFSDYPVLSTEAAKWLTKFDLKGIGFDTISADSADSKDFSIHKFFLKNDTIIIENLVNLDILPSNQFIFSCFPLKFKDADGSPVRAIAYIQ